MSTISTSVNLQCSRCRRTDPVIVKDLAEGQALEQRLQRKTENLEKLKAFVASIPAEDMPDFFSVSEGVVTGHVFLCDPADDSKRSCTTRVEQLSKELSTLEVRKPRSKKAETAPAAEQPAETSTTPAQ